MVRHLPVLAFLALSAVACSDDAAPDAPPPPATPQCAGAPAFTAVDVSATTVSPGDTIDIAFGVENFHFSGGDGHSSHVMHEGGHDAAGGGGHSAGGHSAGGHSAGGHSAGGDSAGGHSHDDHDHGDHDHGDHDHDHGGMPADGCMAGHVHLYVDDVMTNPLAMIITSSATVQIPMDLAPGAHQLIARIHDGSHRIVEPQVIETIDITVE